MSTSAGSGTVRMSERSGEHQSCSVPSLEDLLRTGETALYGQVCWSLANRGTERPAAGEVITLEGGDDAGDPTTKTFRLTPDSIEHIEGCLGIRSCEEAMASIAKHKKIGPWGECPQGHPEEASEYMMYGTEPSEPCPHCGEIPEFSDPSMSLNFYSDEPVKGVGGKDYRECPQCGEDALELRGTSPVEWGWHIACLGCGWEMKQAERLDIAQYCDLMEEVKTRVESINQLMEMPGITIRTRVESVCLQLRMLLELIVLSSLVSNKDVWQKSQKELQSSQDMSKKLKELKRLHPKFYPSPLDLQERTPEGEPAERGEKFLSEDQLIKVYGRLGNILHAENPMGKQTDYRYFMEAVPEWISQVANLLECHKVHLYHHPDEFYLIKMFGDVDGHSMCVPFNTTATGKTKCAWPDCVSSTARLYCEYLQRPWRDCQLPEIEPAQTQGKITADEHDGQINE